MSAFDKWKPQAWPYVYRATIRIPVIAGGIPSDPKVAEGWLRSKMPDYNPEEMLAEQVAETMAERGITKEQALEEVDTLRHLNGFKRDTEDGTLYIEGRQLKAALKEGASIAAASGKSKAVPLRGYANNAKKGVVSFAAEHIQVDEERLYLLHWPSGEPVTEPDEVNQRFVHTFRGSGIQYEECVRDAMIVATIRCDMEMPEEFWPMIWLTGEQQGLGASRSQGYGKYVVETWEQIAAPRKARAAKGSGKESE